MTPHVYSLVPKEDQQLLERIRKMVQQIPDDLKDRNGEKIELSCHLLARAIANQFKLNWKDGYFVLPSHRHSWVVTPNGNIIDVYPIGIINGPLLADMNNCFALQSLYIELPTEMVSKGAFSKPTFRHHLVVLRNEIRRIVSETGTF